MAWAFKISQLIPKDTSLPKRLQFLIFSLYLTPSIQLYEPIGVIVMQATISRTHQFFQSSVINISMDIYLILCFLKRRTFTRTTVEGFLGVFVLLYFAFLGRHRRKWGRKGCSWVGVTVRSQGTKQTVSRTESRSIFPSVLHCHEFHSLGVVGTSRLCSGREARVFKKRRYQNCACGIYSMPSS